MTSGPPWRWMHALLLAAAATAFVIPTAFVDTSPVFTVAAWAALAIGGLCALVLLVRLSSHAGLLAATVFFIPMGLSTVISPGPVILAMFLPFVLGLGVAAVIRNWLRFLQICMLGIVASLLLDQVAGGHVVSNFFGIPFQIRFAEDILRARGFIGQPVPAAMISVYIGAMALVAPSGNEARPALARGIVIGLMFVALIVTGTRSAVLLFVVLGLLIWLTKRRVGPLRISPYAVLGVIAGGLALFAAWPALVRWLGGSRALDFESLSGSVSLDNRSSVSEVWETWAAECDGVCVAFGSGWTNLQSSLRNDLSSYGLSTVDNLFMSILWDFGVLGIALLALAAVIALAGIVRSDSAGQVIRMGGIGALAVIASGAAYDSLYIRPVLMLFGCAVFLLLTRSSRLNSAGQPRQSGAQSFNVKLDPRPTTERF